MSAYRYDPMYRDAENAAMEAGCRAQSWHEKYLELRKTMRNYVKENRLDVPAEIRKAIGLK